MKYKDIETMIRAKDKFENAKSKLEKSLCLTNATFYYNHYPSSDVTSELIPEIKKTYISYCLGACELALEELSNLNVDVSKEYEVLKSMVSQDGR